MSVFSASPSTRRHRGQGIVLVLTLAALIIALYVVNFRSLDRLHQADLSRFQQRMQDYGRSMSYFLSERENDMRVLAGSAPVINYFRQPRTNQAEGDRQKAAKVVLNQFEQHNLADRLGVSIYLSLSLVSAEGETLVAMRRPAITPNQETSTPSMIDTSTMVRLHCAGEGMITFSHPVVIDEQVVGFIQGKLQYDMLVNRLVDTLPGVLAITDQQGVVYRSDPECTFSADLLQNLVRGQLPPVEIGNSLADLQPMSRRFFQDHGHLFFAGIPGYDLFLYMIETEGATKTHQYQRIFSLSLLVLSLSTIVAFGFILCSVFCKNALRNALGQMAFQKESVCEQKQALELVLEGAQLGTWSWDVISGQVEFNERFYTMLGYEPGELPAHLDTWKQLLHPEDGTFVIPVLEAHLRGTTPSYSTEHRLRHKDGHWVWILDIGQVLQRDKEGKPQRAFGIHLDISERRESTRLLAKAKEESDTIIRKFLDTLIVVNTELQVVRVNQTTCNLLGYTENELIGRPVVELFHNTNERVMQAFAFYRIPVDVPPAPEGLLPNITWAVMQASEELRNVELCYRHKDGSRLPMSFNINLLRNERGVVTGCIAGGKDVSGLRQAIDTIGQQKRYIETLFDIVSVGLVALSSENEVVRSNQAFRRMMEHWSQRLSLSTEECSRRMIQGIVKEQATDGTFVFTLDQERTQGYFRCSTTMLSNLAGVVTVVTVDDITSERVAEEAKKFLATVIEQTEDGVLVTGTDGVIRYVNPATVNITGYTTEELIGRMPLVFTDNLVEPQVLDDLRRTLASGESWSGHLRSRRKNGSVIEEEATVSPIRNDQGETTHYVAIWRDITELVELQQQLSQAQKMESIGQLAAGIAHEINTPMQYVQNNVTFFEQSFEELQSLLAPLSQCPHDRLPEEIVRQMGEIDLEFLLDEVPASIRETLQGINRVVKIVAAMKEFSHPGGQEKVSTDINHSLESTLIVCRNEWKYVAELVTDLAEDLPFVPCYVDQLHQALVNLVINASHAIQEKKQSSAETTGQITVSTRAEEGWVEIRIGDNGSGIPEVIRSRIFEPFFTTKEVGKGTGQGLAIVYEVIVNKHGGKVDFVTKKGQGTTFILRLPTDNSNQNALV